MRLSDKVAAIISILELAYAYRDYIPGALHIQRYGDSAQVPSPVRAYNVECNGRCYTCLAYQREHNVKLACPPEEKWERERQQLRREYRVADVEASLDRLADFDNTLAQAVWAEYVEPWPDPKTEPSSKETRERREAYALEGVRWMADDIPGFIRAYGERVDPRDNQIRQLAARGYSQRRIAREVRCSLRDVNRVLTLSVSAVGG